MFNLILKFLFQTKQEPKCFCEFVVHYFKNISYYDCGLCVLSFILFSAFVLYLLHGTSFINWIQQDQDTVEVIHVNHNRTIPIQTTVSMNSNEFYTYEHAEIQGLQWRDNGNNVQDFPNAETERNIHEETENDTYSDESTALNMESEGPIDSSTPKNTENSLSRIPLPNHYETRSPQAETNANIAENSPSYDTWKTNSENEDPVTNAKKSEVSHIPVLNKRSRSKISAPKPLHTRQ